MTSGDTIAALSSGTGPAVRMIVRISGPQSHAIALQLCPDPLCPDSLCPDPLPPPGTAGRVRLHFAGLRAPACLYAFAAPRSYTGEDLIEFHLPGSPPLARLLLDELHRLGCRPAEAGEFTARAYFHGRLDLTGAEGVAAIISAANEGELRAARQLLGGELARRLRPVLDLVAQTLALVEVGIDFVEEDVTFLPADELRRRAADADAMLEQIVARSARFERLAHEPRAVLVGRPNAGKSTLLNALAGRARAVVSPIAGTTRDALSAEVALERGLLRLVDVAGIEEPTTQVATPEGPAARIERQMRAQALREVESADLVLSVHDATADAPPPTLPRPADFLVLTKLDLLAAATLPAASRPLPPFPADRTLGVSAHTGQNLDELRRRLDALAFGDPVPPGGSALALNARHVQAIAEARSALARAAEVAPHAGPEIAALELRDALDALGRILGGVTPDDLLGRIFSAFCMGK